MRGGERMDNVFTGYIFSEIFSLIGLIIFFILSIKEWVFPCIVFFGIGILIKGYCLLIIPIP